MSKATLTSLGRDFQVIKSLRETQKEIQGGNAIASIRDSIALIRTTIARVKDISAKVGQIDRLKENNPDLWQLGLEAVNTGKLALPNATTGTKTYVGLNVQSLLDFESMLERYEQELEFLDGLQMRTDTNLIIPDSYRTPLSIQTIEHCIAFCDELIGYAGETKDFPVQTVNTEELKRIREMLDAKALDDKLMSPEMAYELANIPSLFAGYPDLAPDVIYARLLTDSGFVETIRTNLVNIFVSNTHHFFQEHKNDLLRAEEILSNMKENIEQYFGHTLIKQSQQSDIMAEAKAIEHDLKQCLESFRLECARTDRDMKIFLAARTKYIHKQTELEETAEMLIEKSGNSPALISYLIRIFFIYGHTAYQTFFDNQHYLFTPIGAYSLYSQYGAYLSAQEKKILDEFFRDAKNNYELSGEEFSLQTDKPIDSSVGILSLAKIQLTTGSISPTQWLDCYQELDESQQQKLIEMKIPFKVSLLGPHSLEQFVKIGKHSVRNTSLNPLRKRILKSGKISGKWTENIEYFIFERNEASGQLEIVPIVAMLDHCPQNCQFFLHGKRYYDALRKSPRGSMRQEPYLSAQLYHSEQNVIAQSDKRFTEACARIKEDLENGTGAQFGDTMYLGIEDSSYLRTKIETFMTAIQDGFITTKAEVQEFVGGIANDIKSLAQWSLSKNISENRNDRPRSRLFSLMVSDPEALNAKLLAYASKGKISSLTELQEHLLSLFQEAHQANEESSEKGIGDFLDIESIAKQAGYQFVQSETTIQTNTKVPTSEETEPGKAKITVKPYAWYDKLGTLLQTLRLLDAYENEPITVYQSADKRYAFFYLSKANKTIFISNHYGYATYIVEGNRTNLGNTVVLLQKDFNGHFVAGIDFNIDDVEGWKKEVLRTIETNNSIIATIRLLVTGGILSGEGYESEDTWKAQVSRWNTFVREYTAREQAPDDQDIEKDEKPRWIKFITGQKIAGFRFYQQSLLLTGKDGFDLNFGYMIRSLGGNGYMQYYQPCQTEKERLCLRRKYVASLFADAMEQKPSNSKMLENEIITGHACGSRVSAFLDRIAKGDVKLSRDDIRYWRLQEKDTQSHGLEMVPRMKHKIPRGIQSDYMFIIQLGQDPNRGTSFQARLNAINAFLAQHGQPIL